MLSLQLGQLWDFSLVLILLRLIVWFLWCAQVPKFLFETKKSDVLPLPSLFVHVFYRNLTVRNFFLPLRKLQPNLANCLKPLRFVWNRGGGAQLHVLIFSENQAKEIILFVSSVATESSSPALEWSIWEFLALLVFLLLIISVTHVEL